MKKYKITVYTKKISTFYIWAENEEIAKSNIFRDWNFLIPSDEQTDKSIVKIEEQDEK